VLAQARNRVDSSRAMSLPLDDDERKLLLVRRPPCDERGLPVVRCAAIHFKRGVKPRRAMVCLRCMRWVKKSRCLVCGLVIASWPAQGFLCQACPADRCVRCSAWLNTSCATPAVLCQGCACVKTCCAMVPHDPDVFESALIDA
jgi:hypothetical protein